jgi:hypothetical protein
MSCWYVCESCGEVRTKKHKGQRFCSAKCYGRSISKYGGGITKDSKGYMKLLLPGNRRKREHVAIAEQVLGRPLPKGACVHHIDGNKANNSHDNLVICENQTYHFLLHSRAKLLAAAKDQGVSPDGRKVCFACHKALPKEDFVRSKNRRGGLYGKCRKCHAAMQSLRRKA